MLIKFKENRLLFVSIILFVLGIVILPFPSTTFTSLALWMYGVLFLGLFLGNKHGKKVIIRLMLAGLVFTAVFSIFMESAFKSAEDAIDDVELDYVVVLGSGLWEGKPSPILMNRLNTAKEILDKKPDTVAILSGGKGWDEQVSESEAMAEYLLELGVDQERIVLEKASATTSENIMYSLSLIDKRGEIDKMNIGVVTSDFHLLRATFLFEQYGVPVYGIAAETPVVIVPETHIREYVAMLKTWLFDRGEHEIVTLPEEEQSEELSEEAATEMKDKAELFYKSIHQKDFDTAVPLVTKGLYEDMEKWADNRPSKESTQVMMTLNNYIDYQNPIGINRPEITDDGYKVVIILQDELEIHITFIDEAGKLLVDELQLMNY